MVFPLFLCGLLSGLPFWAPIPYTGAGNGATLVPLPLHHEHRQLLFRADGLAGATLIYSFQPWGGVVIEKSNRLVFQADKPGAPRFPGNTLQTTAGQRTCCEEARGQPKKNSIRPTVQFLRVKNPNWMIAS